VCALVAALAGVSTTQAAPLGGDGASAMQSGLQQLVQYEDSHIVDNNPNFINPCWLIDKAFFDSAESAQYAFSITVRWRSGNHWFRRHVVVAMEDAIIVDPTDTRHSHEAFDTTTWVRLRTVIDVTDHPVDANVEVQGSLKLIRDHGDDDGDDDDDDCDHHHGHGDHHGHGHGHGHGDGHGHGHGHGDHDNDT
jgi:hypothetical protein